MTDGPVNLESYLKGMTDECHNKIKQGLSNVTNKYQSPIDIQYKNKGLVNVQGHPDFKLDYEPSTFYVEGRNLMVKSGNNYAKLSNQTYKLVQYHFHQPAEHRLDGHLHDMEVHLVHQLVKDGDREIDTSKEQLFAVVGVFLKVTDSSTNYPGLQVWNDNFQGSKEPFSFDTNDLLTGQILKGKNELATYSGGLTTPPFAECVMWHVVLNDTISITADQKKKYHSLIGGDNARECFPLHGRKVYFVNYN